MIASIILGMGLPTTAKYIVLSAIAAPALVKLGVPLVGAHLFILYFGVIAEVIPISGRGKFSPGNRKRI